MATPSPTRQKDQVSLVYVARCSLNGKQYVGVTSRGLQERRRKHVARALAGSDLCFHRALRKHGPESFEWRTDSSGLVWEAACVREQVLISELGTFGGERGYNVTKGGEGTLGMPLPEEARQRVSTTLKAMYATPVGEALRARLSVLKTGTKASLESRMKQSARRRGWRMSEESRAKLSASKLRYPDDLRSVTVRLAEMFGYRSVARTFGLPHITIRRWAMSPEARDVERQTTRERNREREYGYRFPMNTQIQMNTQTSPR